MLLSVPICILMYIPHVTPACAPRAPRPVGPSMRRCHVDKGFATSSIKQSVSRPQCAESLSCLTLSPWSAARAGPAGPLSISWKVWVIGRSWGCGLVGPAVLLPAPPIRGQARWVPAASIPGFFTIFLSMSAAPTCKVCRGRLELPCPAPSVSDDEVSPVTARACEGDVGGEAGHRRNWDTNNSHGLHQTCQTHRLTRAR